MDTLVGMLVWRNGKPFHATYQPRLQRRLDVHSVGRRRGKQSKRKQKTKKKKAQPIHTYTEGALASTRKKIK